MTLRDIKRRLATLLPHLLFAAIFSYFAYHVVHGDRGLLHANLLQREVDERSLELAELSGVRQELDARVSGLRRGSLDLDLLEEQSRRVLGYGAENDAMIFLPEKPLVWQN